MNYSADTESTWDSIFAELESIEADLADVLDPGHFETEMLIDEQGQFLNWLDGEARLASQPLPGVETPTLPPVSTDFLGFTEKSAFGVPTRGTAPLETLNQNMGLESQALGANRSENLGLAEADLKELEALSAEVTGFAETKANTGFDLANQIASTIGEDEMPDIPMLDLMDAIAPRKPKEATPKAPEFLEPEAYLEPIVEAVIEPDVEAVAEAITEPVIESVVSQTLVASALTETATLQVNTVTQSHLAVLSNTTMRRYFDITDLLEAQTKLIEVLAMPKVPLVVFLGRAAERCSNALPNISSIAIAEARDEGLVSIHTISAHESFRTVLLEINASRADQPADLTVADLSELELDEVSLPVTTPHLLLTRIAPDPERSGRMRGTLTLTGTVGLKSGAAFLKAVVTRLESPITLML